MDPKFEKFKGVFPAFYACYDENGEISEEGVTALTKHFVESGVKGIYVGGSSGECIYQSVADRKKTLEACVKAAEGKLTIIAHVACNNTRDSMELAAHAESLGVDAIAAIPPIYFKLPDHAIAKYWNDISSAAPNTDFIIYNIPGCAGIALTKSLLAEMVKNPRVIGVKNSSMPSLDIWEFKTVGSKDGRDFIVFNGPDEQYICGRSMGACGGIGGTYGVMPKIYVKLEELYSKGDVDTAAALQADINEIIATLYSGHGNMYAVIKEVMKIRDGIDLHGVRAPLANVIDSDAPVIAKSVELINAAVAKYL